MNIKKHIALGIIVTSIVAFLSGTSWGQGTTSPTVAKRYPGMFALYEANKKNGVANYITEDFLLMAHSMILNETITDMEETVLLPAFKNIVDELVTKYSTAEDAVRKANLNFLIVLQCLLNGSSETKAAVSPELVSKELTQINAANGIAPSEIMHQRLDFSQFKPRGKYTRNDALKGYFQAMRYASTVLFPVKASKATGLTEADADVLTSQAMSLVKEITTDKALHKAYKDMNTQLAWLFGPADDLILGDYLSLNKAPKEKDITNIRSGLLAYAQKNNKQPRILSGFVDASSLENNTTAQDVLTGWRFFPQHYSADSAAFQDVVYDRVTTFTGTGKTPPFTGTMIDGKLVKGFPMGLELLALMGSKDASAILDKTQECAYEGYKEGAAKAQKALKVSPGLFGESLKLINYWVKEKNSDTDAKRTLNTFLGFWTSLRYSTLLYAKQSYTSGGKGISVEKGTRDMAWLEPVPELYAQMEKQVNNFLKNFPKTKRLQSYKSLLVECQKIAKTEGQTKKLSSKDSAFLNQLDEKLLPLAGHESQVIVVDVHTEPNSGFVLEEALGYPLMVEIPLGDGSARGALFHYYEFKYPMDNRLDNASWKQLLNEPDFTEKVQLSPSSTLVNSSGVQE